MSYCNNFNVFCFEFLIYSQTCIFNQYPYFIVLKTTLQTMNQKKLYLIKFYAMVFLLFKHKSPQNRQTFSLLFSTKISKSGCNFFLLYRLQSGFNHNKVEYLAIKWTIKPLSRSILKAKRKTWKFLHQPMITSVTASNTNWMLVVSKQTS
jgi:hypothetical protein